MIVSREGALAGRDHLRRDFNFLVLFRLGCRVRNARLCYISCHGTSTLSFPALGSFKGGQIGELEERRRAAKTGGVASTGRLSNVIMMEVGMRFSALRILYFPLTRASRIQITFMQYAAVAAVEIHLLWIEPVHHPPPGHYLVDGGNADGFGAVPVALLDARGVLEF